MSQTYRIAKTKRDGDDVFFLRARVCIHLHVYQNLWSNAEGAPKTSHSDQAPEIGFIMS